MIKSIRRFSMKTMNKIKTAISQIALITIFLSILISCSNGERELTLQITAVNGTFSGNYSIDGGALTSFVHTSYENNQAIFEKKIKILENIAIEITAENTATSLTLRIYEDGQIVKNENKTGNGTETLFIQLNYLLDENNAPTDQTTDTQTPSTETP